MNTEPEVFEQLYFRYVTKTHAFRALETWKAIREGSSKQKLENILRHHEERAVDSDALIALRDSFDYLLSFYSMLEVGYALGYLHGDLPLDLRKEAKAILKDPVVSRYYRINYPLLLPELFLHRLNGRLFYRSASPDGAEDLFNRFLDLNLSIERDDSVGNFLWLLDWGDFYGENVQDFLKFFGEPERLEKGLSTGPNEDEPIISAVHGFRTFLEFCPDYLEYLQQFSAQPIVQSILWHYHAYWFDRLRDELSGTLSTVIELIQGWRNSDQDLFQAQLECKKALAMLTSGRFGWTLRELVVNAPEVSAKAHRPIKVALIEGDVGFRQIVTKLLAGSPKIHAVGLYSNAEHALKGIQQNEPDVVLLDAKLPDEDGLKCLAKLKVMKPALPIIIMLQSSEDARTLFDSLRIGAHGYLLKKEAPKEILEAISDAHAGGSPMSTKIAQRIVQAFQSKSSSQVGLTPREETILDYLANGGNEQGIAVTFQLSSATVKAHMRNIYGKLGLGLAKGLAKSPIERYQKED